MIWVWSVFPAKCRKSQSLNIFTVSAATKIKRQVKNQMKNPNKCLTLSSDVIERLKDWKILGCFHREDLHSALKFCDGPNFISLTKIGIYSIFSGNEIIFHIPYFHFKYNSRSNVPQRKTQNQKLLSEIIDFYKNSPSAL